MIVVMVIIQLEFLFMCHPAHYIELPEGSGVSAGPQGLVHPGAVWLIHWMCV